MAKSRRKKKQSTNWQIVAIVIVGGFLVFTGLMALAMRETPPLDLAAFCQNNPAQCVVEGEAAAAVTIVEVSDYGCSHCRDFNLETGPALQSNYVQPGKVQWITLPFALQGQSGSYPTLPTAVAALCANEQGAFRTFHRAAFEQQSDPLFNTRQGFMQIASGQRLNVDDFAACLDDNAYEPMVLQNIRAAQSAGVSATPTFFINGSMLRGANPLSIFQQRIDALLGS